jgi:cytochrome P450
MNLFRDFESGIMKLLLGLSMLATRTTTARGHMATAFTSYFAQSHHLEGSALIQAHVQHVEDYEVPMQDLAQLEVAAALGILSNIVPSTVWLLYHLFSTPSALSTCRAEILSVTNTSKDEKGTLVHTIDVAKVRTSCPTLLSCFKETLRIHTVGASARLVMQDTTISSPSSPSYTLKKNSIVLLPQQIMHTDATIWGPTVSAFSATRFLQKSSKKNQVTFRGFGGGTTLCPGRHFATTEVLAYAALFVMRFDVEPEGGEWVEPKT